MLFLVFLLILAAVTLGVLAFAKPKGRDQVSKRLKKNARTRGKQAPGPEAPATLFGKLEARLKPYAVKRLTAERELAMLRRLQAAGHYDTTPAQLLTRQIIWAVLIPAFWVFVNWMGLGMAIPTVLAGTAVAAYLGYILPTSRLKTETELRQVAILKMMPTTLDLMTTCVEAGLSLQAAMQKVVELTKPHPMREELARTLQEIGLGRPRNEALRDLGKRVGLKELNSVAIAMVQAESMGTSIAKTLRTQSEMLREARWQKAQEMAQKATLKLLFPTVVFIFPCIFIIIFGPLAIGLMFGK
ncbi:Bacterial type II secretion system protein F domain protein [compost metagenome]